MSDERDDQGAEPAEGAKGGADSGLLDEDPDATLDGASLRVAYDEADDLDAVDANPPLCEATLIDEEADEAGGDAALCEPTVIDDDSAEALDEALDEATVTDALDERPLGEDEPPASPFPHVEPAPERAGRRVAPGMRIATRLSISTVVAAVLPALLGAAALVLVPDSPSEAPRVELPPGLGDELSRAERSLDDIGAKVAALDERVVTLEKAALEDALAAAIPTLMQRIAEARDERRAAGADRKALRAPFTAEEIAPVLERIGVTPEGGRLVVQRDGVVLAPEGRALPTSAELVVDGEGAALLTTVVDRDGARVLLGRRCVVKEPLCLVEERPLPAPGIDARSTRTGVARVRAQLSSLQSPPSPTPQAGLDATRLRAILAAGAVALGVLLGLLLARRLVAQLSRPLAVLEGRLRLLATGRTSERAPLSRPAELEALEDAVDALAETLGELERREEQDAQRARRMFALADLIGEAARGQLFLRAPPADDVAEEALGDAINRLLEAFERQVVRMKSHLLVLARQDEGAAEKDEEAGEGRVQMLQRRIHGLRPVASLLGDISQRLSAIAKLPRGEARVPAELSRLGEAIGQRAKTAHGLFDALEAEAARLSDTSAHDAKGLSREQRRALEALAQDLEALAVDETLPTLLDSLRDLDDTDIASRLATRGAGA